MLDSTILYNNTNLVSLSNFAQKIFIELYYDQSRNDNINSNFSIWLTECFSIFCKKLIIQYPIGVVVDSETHAYYEQWGTIENITMQDGLNFSSELDFLRS